MTFITSCDELYVGRSPSLNTQSINQSIDMSCMNQDLDGKAQRLWTCLILLFLVLESLLGTGISVPTNSEFKLATPLLTYLGI